MIHHCGILRTHAMQAPYPNKKLVTPEGSNDFVTMISGCRCLQISSLMKLRSWSGPHFSKPGEDLVSGLCPAVTTRPWNKTRWWLSHTRILIGESVRRHDSLLEPSWGELLDGRCCPRFQMWQCWSWWYHVWDGSGTLSPIWVKRVYIARYLPKNHSFSFISCCRKSALRKRSEQISRRRLLCHKVKIQEVHWPRYDLSCTIFTFPNPKSQVCRNVPVKTGI